MEGIVRHLMYLDKIDSRTVDQIDKALRSYAQKKNPTFFLNWFIEKLFDKSFSPAYVLYKTLIFLYSMRYHNDDPIIASVIDYYQRILNEHMQEENKSINEFSKESFGQFQALLKYYQISGSLIDMLDLDHVEFKDNLSYIDPRLKDNKEWNDDTDFKAQEPFTIAIEEYNTVDFLIQWFAKSLVYEGFYPEFILFEILKHLKDLNFSSDDPVLVPLFNSFHNKIMNESDLHNSNKRPLTIDEMNEFKTLLDYYNYPYVDELHMDNIQPSKIADLPIQNNNEQFNAPKSTNFPNKMNINILDKAKFIAQTAKEAGFNAQSAIVAVAIALAESQGNPNNIGDSSLQTDFWGESIGLWQIRSIKTPYLDQAHGTDALRNRQKLFDPNYNAQTAYIISKNGTNWYPWSTYKDGSYEKYLNIAQTAIQSVY